MKIETTDKRATGPVARFPSSVRWHYSQSAITAAEKLTPGTVDEQSQQLGMIHAEPLLIALDALLQYAAVYRARYEAPLAQDNVLGVYWLDALKGIHGLLNGDGAVAMQRGITTDSKSNGVLEDIYWAAIEQAGFKQEDL